MGEDFGGAGSTTHRVARVLNLFLLTGADHGVTEISRAMGCSKAVVHRILVVLVEEGLLDRDAGTRRYRLGPAFLKLRPYSRDQAQVARLAWPYLQAVTRRTNETAILSMLIGRKRVHIQQTLSDSPVHVTVPIGARTDLHESASGLVMLANLEAEERLAIIEETSRTGGGIAQSGGDLFDEVRLIRRRGYAVHHNEHVGTLGVAAPIFDQFGSVVGALSIIALSARTDAARIAAYGAALRDEATHFSRDLGWTRSAEEATART